MVLIFKVQALLIQFLYPQIKTSKTKNIVLSIFNFKKTKIIKLLF